MPYPFITNLQKEFDYHFELLDIGGGFTAFSSQEMTFAKVSNWTILPLVI